MAVEQKNLKKECASLLRVPIDIIPREELADQVTQLVFSPEKNAKNALEAKQEGKNIVLLSLWDLLRARRNKEYRKFVLNASMILPISKSLLGGARFLTGKNLIRYMPFHFIVDLLTVLEARECTVYLLGSSDRILKKVESNIRQTFPGLQIVGRCNASFRKRGEATIVEAIRKTAPQLLLVGKGVPGGELWIARHHKQLNKGLRLWCSDIFEVFVEKKSRPSEKIFNAGLESLLYCAKNPFKLLRIFPYFWYKFLLLIYKIFKKS